MNTSLAKKVYDFKLESVKTKLLSTFKKRRSGATIADLISLTGLPKYQIEQSIKHVLNEYNGHLKVTETGELLYYFPYGLHSKFKGLGPSLKRFFKTSLKLLARLFTFLFKIWIMLMLVGYFITFLVLALLAIFTAIAASSSRSNSSSRSRSRSSDSALYLIFRIIELFLRIFFWVNLTKATQRQTPASRPFYKSIFAFVFGEKDPNQNYEEELKLKILSFIRSNKGIISPDELMTFTGKNYLEAQEFINSYLVEFEGEPKVTEEGTLYYFFPELLRTSRDELLLARSVSVGEHIYKKPIIFSTNPKKTNRLIFFFNCFNLFFGLYFSLSHFLAMQNPESSFSFLYIFTNQLLFDFFNLMQPQMLVFTVLGIIPLSFSLIFFLIPFFRNQARKKENQRITLENIKKDLFTDIYYSSPNAFDPLSFIQKNNLLSLKQEIIQELDRYAGFKEAELNQNEKGHYIYNFKNLIQEQNDLASCRQKIDLKNYEIGKTIFDSNV